MADEPKVLSMDEFNTLVTETVEKQIRDMGLDKIDLKHGVIPSKDDPDPQPTKELTGDQKVMKFFTAVVNNDQATAKALSEGTPADGGYLVPTEFRQTVISKLYKESLMRQRVTVIPMGSDKMEIPKEGAGVTVYWTPENDTLTESNPTFGTMTLNTNKLTGLSKLSRELFADARTSVIDLLATVFTRAIKTEEERCIVAGDGTGKPKGIRTYTLTDVAQAGANIAADDVVKLFYALPSQYRDRATWILHNAIIAKLRLLKDTTGRYLWADSFNEAPNTLMGRPVAEVNDLPTNLGSGTNESEIIFGDLSAYLLGDREEMGVETTTVGAGAFERHQVAFKMWERIDGQLGLTDGFIRMTGVK